MERPSDVVVGGWDDKKKKKNQQQIVQENKNFYIEYIWTQVSFLLDRSASILTNLYKYVIRDNRKFYNTIQKTKHAIEITGKQLVT